MKLSEVKQKLKENNYIMLREVVEYNYKRLEGYKLSENGRRELFIAISEEEKDDYKIIEIPPALNYSIGMELLEMIKPDVYND